MSIPELTQNGRYRPGTFQKSDTSKAIELMSFPSEAEECQEDTACANVYICVCICAFYCEMISLLPATQEPLFADLFFFKPDGQEALGKDWNLILGRI